MKPRAVLEIALALGALGCGGPPPLLTSPPPSLAYVAASKPVLPPEPDWGELLFPSRRVAAEEPQVVASSGDASSPNLAEPGVAAWTSTNTADGGEIWTRSRGARAADLVLRGETRPVHPEYCCGEFSWGARRTRSLKLHLEGAKRPLRVWAKALGPMGLSVDRVATEVSANEVIVTDLPDASGDIYVDVADVDRPKERRGQTSPYVIVITDDLTAPRLEVPDPRPTKSSNAVLVSWDLRPVKCVGPPEEWSCFDADLILNGTTRVRLPHPLAGQSGCFPDRAGIECGGASGATLYELTVGPTGAATVMSHAYSDGSCEGEPVCGSHAVEARFNVAPGAELIADPAGTFPPAP